MTLTIKKGNVFTAPPEYYLAHCISADYELGAGIAVDFQKKYHLKQTLKTFGSGTYPDCILINKVFNLVTKAKYWNKPTYDAFEIALNKMRDMMVEQSITKLATYKLGCTRDRLQWGRVRELIETVFNDTDVDILIYHI